MSSRWSSWWLEKALQEASSLLAEAAEHKEESETSLATQRNFLGKQF